MALAYGTDWYEVRTFTVHADQKGMTATRTVRVVDPNNIFAFITSLLPVATGGFPAAAAEFPNTPFLIVNSLEITPFGDDENFPASPPLSLNPANGFQVVINYSTRDYDQPDNVNTDDLPYTQLDQGNPTAWFGW